MCSTNRIVGDLADDQRDAASAAYERDQPDCCPGIPDPLTGDPHGLHSDACHVLSMQPDRCNCYGCMDTAPGGES
jgi:hypothetical protein